MESGLHDRGHQTLPDVTRPQYPPIHKVGRCAGDRGVNEVALAPEGDRDKLAETCNDVWRTVATVESPRLGNGAIQRGRVDYGHNVVVAKDEQLARSSHEASEGASMHSSAVADRHSARCRAEP